MEHFEIPRLLLFVLSPLTTTKLCYSINFIALQNK